MVRYYIDTCVWIDLLSERDTQALNFFLSLNKNDVIIVSDLLIKEIKRNNLLEPFLLCLNYFEKMTCEASSEIIIEAREVEIKHNTKPGDTFHAIFARNMDAILVTKDKDFLKLNFICEVKFL